MAYQLFPYKYEKVIQFSNNTSSFEVYFGGKLGPVDYGVKIGNFGVSVYILQAQYYIGNTLKIQGLLGEWVDNAGNTWTFTRGGLTVTTPDGHIKTVNMPSPSQQDGKYTCMVLNLSSPVEGEYFRIRTYTNSIPYEDITQTVITSALRTGEDEQEALELSTALFEQSVDNYDAGTIIYAPFYNTFENNDYPIKCLGAIFTNRISETFEGGSELGSSTATIFDGSFTGFINPAEDNPDDPYQPGGTTTPGGGQGSFDRSSDPIEVPGLPLLSAIDTGFVSLWRPSSTELINLYNYMWSNAFDLESFKKIFANPIDAIMGFGIIPLNPVTAAARSLKIGNIDTGVYVTPITEQYYQVDCGTLYLDNYFDTYLEFEPYSTLEIFLPFCGCMQLSADDFYRRKKEFPGGGKINVKYNVDILSGSCVAFISCYDANGATTMTYEFNGNLLTQIPITGNDFSGLYNAVLGIAGNVVSGVAHAATGNAAGILGDVVNAAHNVTSAKPSINRSGTIGGSYGLLANRKPFLIRNIPREAVAWAQNTFQGYPSHITTVIRSINGYTEFEKVYTDNIPASDNELKEIVQILETGVIL